MEINFYSSPITMPVLAACGGVALLIFNRNKNIGSFSLAFGFIFLIVSKITAKYCTGISLLESTINNYPFFCNSVTPYVEGVAFILITYGLTKFVPEKQT